ncbi:hypothetical protein Fmac_016977 [Flemingia macrophylla]|uniref:Uncharacterized protein n=1 Tax=Flemingia macrophylla TaxID=520843 RepID=A0ABD1MJ28_9FABA
MDIGYSSFPQYSLVERPNSRFVQTATHFLPLQPTILNPILPFGQQIFPLQHMVYNPNQVCPVYLVPIAATTQALMNPNASSVNSHVHHNNSTSHTQSYITDNETASFVYVPCNGNQEQEMDTRPMHHQSQSKNISVTTRESPRCEDDLDNDLAQVHICKPQPPPPSLPSKHQAMTKAATNLLSEALARLQVDNLMPQTQTLQ